MKMKNSKMMTSRVQHAASKLAQPLMKQLQPLKRIRVQALADGASLTAQLKEKLIGSVLLAAEECVYSLGWTRLVTDVLDEASIAWQLTCVDTGAADWEKKAADAAQAAADSGVQAIVALGTDSIASWVRVLAHVMAQRHREKQAGEAMPVYALPAAPVALSYRLLCSVTEAYLCANHSAARQSLSDAAALLIRNLQNAMEGNATAQSALQEAAAIALPVLVDTPNGHARSIAHQLTGDGVRSDESQPAALIAVLEAYGAAAQKLLAALACNAGLASWGAGGEVAAEALMTWLRQMNGVLGIPAAFGGLAQGMIPVRAADTVRAVSMSVPVKLDRFELEAVYRCLADLPERQKDIVRIVSAQRAYVRGQGIPAISAREDALTRLRRAIEAREQQINDALRSDLGKCPEEAYLCEVGMTLAELSHMQRHLRHYARRRHVLTPLHQFAADSFVMPRPYGVVLIMSPWNYPFLLTMGPLIGAVAAGNSCMVKPSAYAPATSAVIREIVEECFPEEQAAVVEGGRAENQALLEQQFDKIFFTGSEAVGKEVMRRAAEHLTPVTLELGGKSPVIVDQTANIDLAARRIAFGKLLNGGQTCVAPDYVLVHRSVKDELVERLKVYFARMAGADALENENLVHIVNRRHFDRVMGLIDPARVVYGGSGDPESLRIQPTIMDNVSAADAVMQEEIFGPVLPLVEFEQPEEAVEFVRSLPTPLAFYLFTGSRAMKKYFLEAIPFGGGCVNDTIIHLASQRLPFGGLGRSGMGRYHGRYSFECFSHEAGVVDKATWIDLPMRYAPYKPGLMKLIRFFLK